MSYRDRFFLPCWPGELDSWVVEPLLVSYVWTPHRDRRSTPFSRSSFLTLFTSIL
jgi:hypothetical protein